MKYEDKIAKLGDKFEPKYGSDSAFEISISEIENKQVQEEIKDVAEKITRIADNSSSKNKNRIILNELNNILLKANSE